MATVTTRLRIAGWDENSVAEFDDGSKITRATVELTDGADGLECGRFESVMYYRPDGTSTYVNVMRLTATLDGRSGSFVLTGDGTYDGTTASGCPRSCRDLPPVTSLDSPDPSAARPPTADYPFMPLILDYDLT